jgi:hypothetical protein
VNCWLHIPQGATPTARAPREGAHRAGFGFGSTDVELPRRATRQVASRGILLEVEER